MTEVSAASEVRVENAAVNIWPHPLTIFAGDVLGFMLAWFSLLPIFILVGFVVLILFHRDLHTVSSRDLAV